MKKIAIPFVALSLLCAAVLPARADVKVGTVDMTKVFASFWRTKEADNKMNEVRSSIKRELDEQANSKKELEVELNKLTEDLKKTEINDQKKALIARDREKKYMEWQDVAKDLEAKAQEKQKALADQMMRVRNGLVKEINDVVKAQALAQGFDLVFDSSGNSVNHVPVLLYSNPSFDFTKAVVDKLNADRPKGSAADKPEELAPATAVAPPATPPAATGGGTRKPR